MSFHETVNRLCAKLNERDNAFQNFGPRQFETADLGLDQEIADFLRSQDWARSEQIIESQISAGSASPIELVRHRLLERAVVALEKIATQRDNQK